MDRRKSATIQYRSYTDNGRKSGSYKDDDRLYSSNASLCLNVLRTSIQPIARDIMSSYNIMKHTHTTFYKHPSTISQDHINTNKQRIDRSRLAININKSNNNHHRIHHVDDKRLADSNRYEYKDDKHVNEIDINSINSMGYQHDDSNRSNRLIVKNEPHIDDYRRPRSICTPDSSKKNTSLDNNNRNRLVIDIGKVSSPEYLKLKSNKSIKLDMNRIKDNSKTISNSQIADNKGNNVYSGKNVNGIKIPYRLFEVKTRKQKIYRVKLNDFEKIADSDRDNKESFREGKKNEKQNRRVEEEPLSEEAFITCEKLSHQIQELYNMYPTKRDIPKLIQLINQFIDEDFRPDSKMREIFLSQNGRGLKSLELLKDYHIYSYIVDDIPQNILHENNGIHKYYDMTKKQSIATFQFLELIDSNIYTKKNTIFTSEKDVRKKMSTYPINMIRYRDTCIFYDKITNFIVNQKKEVNKMISQSMQDKLISIKNFKIVPHKHESVYTNSSRNLKPDIIRVSNPLIDDKFIQSMTDTIGRHRNLMHTVRNWEIKYHQEAVIDEIHKDININVSDTINQLTSL